jgi:hypothetical protein
MVDIYTGPENTHWVLHEKLLCHHSPFLRKIFYSKNNSTKSYGLPEEEDVTFKTLVGWLYSSRTLPIPREEGDLGLQFDLYLLAEKLQIPALQADILQVVREWYRDTDTYPGLRRVQYIYGNTEEGSAMRTMLVNAIARMFVVGTEIPKHWDKALRKNGQLAVDILKAIQDWRVEPESVPDVREDPAAAEEMMDEEIEQQVGVEEEGEELEQEGEEAEGGKEDDKEVGAEQDDQKAESEAGVDSSEDTVVESPVETKAPNSFGGKASKKEKKNKSDSITPGLEKLSLNEVPNTVSLDDYGTLH